MASGGPAPAPSCRVCSAPASSRCAACRCARYCTTQCQRQDWPTHRGSCAFEAFCLRATSPDLRPGPQLQFVRAGALVEQRISAASAAAFLKSAREALGASPAVARIFANATAEELAAKLVTTSSDPAAQLFVLVGLLAAGAGPSSRGALHAAARRSDSDARFVRALVYAGADLSLLDNGLRALEAAAAAGTSAAGWLQSLDDATTEPDLPGRDADVIF